MQTLFTKALVAAVVLAGVGFATAPPAQAVNRFTLSGQAGSVALSPSVGTSDPVTVMASFSGLPIFSNLNGDFLGITDAVIETPLTFSLVNPLSNPARYSLPSFDITFTGASNGITTVTVFGPNTLEGDYERLGNSSVSTIASVVELQARDNNNLAYIGQLVILDTSSNNSLFSISFTAVPEPLTVLGASTAVAFGAAFKRRQGQKG